MSVSHFLQRKLFLLLPCLLGAVGCGDLMRMALDDDSQPPVKNEVGLAALGKKFGDAVQKGDYAAAYALCSSQLKARRTEEQFVAELKNDWQLHAEGVNPQEFRVGPWMVDKVEFDEWEDMPKDIKYAQVEGIVAVTFALQVEDGGYVSSVTSDLVVVQEDGQPKIAHVCELVSAD